MEGSPAVLLGSGLEMLSALWVGWHSLSGIEIGVPYRFFLNYCIPRRRDASGMKGNGLGLGLSKKNKQEILELDDGR